MCYHTITYPILTRSTFHTITGPHLEVSVRDLGFVTHLLEELHASLVQEHTDEHPALVGRLQDVTEDLHVCEHVHQDGQDLGQGRGVGHQKVRARC